MIEYFLIFFIWAFFSSVFIYIYREGRNEFYGVWRATFALVVFVCLAGYSGLAWCMLKAVAECC